MYVCVSVFVFAGVRGCQGSAVLWPRLVTDSLREMSRPGRWTFLFLFYALRRFRVVTAEWSTWPRSRHNLSVGVFFCLFFDSVLSKICLTSYGDQFNRTLSLSLNWQF